MNKSKINVFLSIFLLVALSFVCIFSFIPIFYANAETSIGNEIRISDDTMILQDDNFTVRFQGFNHSNAIMNGETKDPIKVLDKSINYIYYNWSELNYLKINMSAPYLSSSTQFTGAKLYVSYLQTEDWKQNVSSDTNLNKDKVIYETTIFGNNFPTVPFTFYIDEQTNISEGVQTKFGNGFGIYKFEFVYSFIESSQNKNIDKSMGSIYFAIVPDNVDEVEGDINIKYTISSSDQFLNVYHLYLDTSTYNYVNPCYVVWTIEGVDQNNMRYVLTESDRVGQYYSYEALWPSYENRNGKTFVFDSNGVEGDFEIYCTIYDTDGQIKTFDMVEVTTIKDKTFSYLWLIIVLCIVFIIIVASIILIIVLKKKEKLW